MKEPPEVIWLQWHGDAEQGAERDDEPSGVTWAESQMFSRDVRYIRDDGEGRAK